MITINASSTALIAQNDLNASQDALSDNMLQLSTGSRINSAADDAAGLQITNRMETQISGLDQAQRNANDAISMAQTAEGAMQETTDILNRTRDLALQSANGSNTADDRTAIQAEVEQLEAEINDIAENTNFAGIDLLDGSASEAKGGMTFQVGAESDETINFSIEDMSASALGGTSSTVDLGIVLDGTGDTETSQVVLTSKIDGVETTLDIDADTATFTEVADQLNEDLSSAGMDGITATVDSDADGKPTGVSLVGSGLEDQTVGTVVGTAAAVDKTVKTGEAHVDDIDLTNQTSARAAVDILDGALAQVDAERAELGAVQNRLESKVDNLSNMEENMSAAQSQMLDADFAEQTTEMTSNQMLMQSGASVLSQAKTMPQYATQLMG